VSHHRRQPNAGGVLFLYSCACAASPAQIETSEARRTRPWLRPFRFGGQSHAKRSAVARAQSIGQAEFASQLRLEGQPFFNRRDPPGHSAVGNLRQAFAQLQAHQLAADELSAGQPTALFVRQLPRPAHELHRHPSRVGVRVRHRRVGDAGELRDEGRDRAARVDEGGILALDAVPFELDRADFENRVTVGVEAGGFEVEGGEGAHWS